MKPILLLLALARRLAEKTGLIPSRRSVCGKHGCTKPSIKQVRGSLTYETCEKHAAEIEALVASE